MLLNRLCNEPYLESWYMPEKKKPNFIRVDADLYEKIKLLAELDDRSINNMANRLLRKVLEK